MSLHELIKEIQKIYRCLGFSNRAEIDQSEHCPGVKNYEIERKDILPLDSAVQRPECDDLSQYVAAVISEDKVKCLWKTGHFDVGWNVEFPQDHLSTGYIQRQICRIFHQDCQVVNNLMKKRLTHCLIHMINTTLLTMNYQ